MQGPKESHQRNGLKSGCRHDCIREWSVPGITAAAIQEAPRLRRALKCRGNKAGRLRSLWTFGSGSGGYIDLRSGRVKIGRWSRATIEKNGLSVDRRAVFFHLVEMSPGFGLGRLVTCLTRRRNDATKNQGKHRKTVGCAEERSASLLTKKIVISE